MVTTGLGDFMSIILTKLFYFVFGKNAMLATIVVSMFPIIELKGAIPLGMSEKFWGDSALTSTQAFVCSLIGSCLVVPVIAWIFTPIILWMKKTRALQKMANYIENKVMASGEKIKITANRNTGTTKIVLLKMLGVFMFVALPLPLTGVWTGTCIAVVIGLKFWQTILAVISGNIVAGTLVMFVCSVFPKFTDIILYIFIVVVLCTIIMGVIKGVVRNKTRKNS